MIQRRHRVQLEWIDLARKAGLACKDGHTPDRRCCSRSLSLTSGVGWLAARLTPSRAADGFPDLALAASVGNRPAIYPRFFGVAVLEIRRPGLRCVDPRIRLA